MWIASCLATRSIPGLHGSASWNIEREEVWEAVILVQLRSCFHIWLVPRSKQETGLWASHPKNCRIPHSHGGWSWNALAVRKEKIFERFRATALWQNKWPTISRAGKFLHPLGLPELIYVPVSTQEWETTSGSRLRCTNFHRLGNRERVPEDCWQN